jgi:hypothetical protein
MPENHTELKTKLRGDLIQPSDSGYHDVRKLYNAMIDKKPRLIARCVDVADETRLLVGPETTGKLCTPIPHPADTSIS